MTNDYSSNSTNLPRISIITPSYNQGDFLEETIQSVLNQNYPNLEYIIIDGGSTDSSVEIIKKYEENFFYWISEPDLGVYDALNKGLERSTGEIIGFINSDDVYCKIFLKELAQVFIENSNIDAIIGNSFINKDNKIIAISQNNYESNPLWVILFGTPSINAWFFKKNVVSDLGVFDTNFQIASDRDFLIRFVYNRKRLKFWDFDVYIYRSHVGSKTISFTDENKEKVLKSIFKYQRSIFMM